MLVRPTELATPCRSMYVASMLVCVVSVISSAMTSQASPSYAHDRGAMSITGQPLKSCSQPGTAMTGFTRDGRCADVGPADAGAHHVCIQMKADFCTVTGQPNWCTTRNFPCMEKPGTCKIGNWCVCQWAFSRYLERAGGCESITDLVCDATNQAAFDAYARSNRAADKAALACIKKRCKFGTGENATDSAGLIEETMTSSIATQTKVKESDNKSCKADLDGKIVVVDGCSASDM